MRKGIIISAILAAAVLVGCDKDPVEETPEEEKPEVIIPVEGDYPIDPVSTLTDKSATSEAKALYDYLMGTYGKSILSGVQSEIGNHKECQFAQSIKDVSGKYPVIQGFDYIFQHWGETNWTSLAEITAEVEDHWKNKGIAAFSWHWNVPSRKGETDPAAYGFYLSGDGKTNFDIREALKKGTWQNDLILQDIDYVSENLKKLADKGIPVLWRPLHEAAGDYTWGAWFWWGRYGHEYTAELWKLMYDRMVNVNGVHNLIWVWTFQTSDKGKLASLDKIAATYPGDEYVDIVGADVYDGDHSIFNRPDIFKIVNNAVKGKKMVALCECGNLPDVDKCFSGGEPWLYFLAWTDAGFGAWNSNDIWKKVMNNSKTLTRESLK